jgi:hypothetical protein
MNGSGMHRGSTFVLSFALMVLGLAVVVESLAESTSALAGRLLIGILMVAAGGLRLFLALRGGRT